MENYRELVGSLKRGVISPVYLFCGEEAYLQDRAVDRVREFFAASTGAVCDLLDGEETAPAEIAARAQTPPLFGGKRLLVVKNPPYLAAAAAGKADGEIKKRSDRGGYSPQEAPLAAYLEEPSPHTCLVFVVRGGVDRRRALCALIEQKGRCFEFKTPGRDVLKKWLDQKAKAQGKVFAPGAKDALLASAGHSMYRLAAELEKLVCYTGERPVIEVLDVGALCPPVPEEGIFRVVDAAGGRDIAKALSGIKNLLAAREPPLKILAMLARQFRLLLVTAEIVLGGGGPPVVAKKLGVQPFVAKKLVLQAKNFDVQTLVRALEDLAGIDLDLKTGRREFYPAVEAFFIKLLGRGR